MSVKDKFNAGHAGMKCSGERVKCRQSLDRYDIQAMFSDQFGHLVNMLGADLTAEQGNNAAGTLLSLNPIFIVLKGYLTKLHVQAVSFGHVQKGFKELIWIGLSLKLNDQGHAQPIVDYSLRNIQDVGLIPAEGPGHISDQPGLIGPADGDGVQKS
jgi:hypothetical protein